MGAYLLLVRAFPAVGVGAFSGTVRSGPRGFT